MSEVPWNVEIGQLDKYGARVNGDELMRLWYREPDSGMLAFVHCSLGPSRHDGRYKIWHIDVLGEIATLTPSIHRPDHYHSPNPVKFKLVEGLR